MHQNTAQPLRFLGENAGSRAVDGHGNLWLVLGLIDSGVGGGIDYDRRLLCAHDRANRIGIGEIDLWIFNAGYLTETGEFVAQFPSDLTYAAKNQHLRLRHSLPLVQFEGNRIPLLLTRHIDRAKETLHTYLLYSHHVLGTKQAAEKLESSALL
jgi:hypothetical protein